MVEALDMSHYYNHPKAVTKPLFIARYLILRMAGKMLFDGIQNIPIQH